MHCSACGTQMADGKLRCPECHRFTPGLWLNLYCLSLLIALSLANFIHLWKMVPIMANMAAGLGFTLPLAMRLYIRLSNMSATLLLWVLILAIPVLFVLKGKKVRVPNFVMSGKLLAVVTWVALVFSLVGIFVGYIEVLTKMPRLIR